MAKAVYVITGKKSNNTEYPTVGAAETAMDEEMNKLEEPNLVGKVYELVKAKQKVCSLDDLPV